MQSADLLTIVNTVVIPLSLFFIMMGMGLTLVTNDFKRVLQYPKAVGIGLLNQLIMLPIIGFALVSIMPLDPEYAVGFMLLVLCPGGTTSNLFTYLAKGDVALSVTMTAIASIITVFTIPIITSFSLSYFMDMGNDFQIPIPRTILTLVVLTLLPISIGMLINRYKPHMAKQWQVYVSRFGVVFLALLVVFLSFMQKDNVIAAFASVGVASIILNLTTMALGYYTSKWTSLNLAQRTSITLEVGLQNGSLAIFIALTFLENYKVSLTPAIYSLVMFLTAGIMVRVFRTLYDKNRRARFSGARKVQS